MKIIKDVLIKVSIIINLVHRITDCDVSVGGRAVDSGRIV